MKPFKKLASFFVTAYANRVFRNAVKIADSWHEGTGKRYYVIFSPEGNDKLVTIDDNGFLAIRKAMGMTGKEYPIAKLKNTCWYYTPNISDKDRITDRELEVRRLAFVRDRIKKAKLL